MAISIFIYMYEKLKKKNYGISQRSLGIYQCGLVIHIPYSVLGSIIKSFLNLEIWVLLNKFFECFLSMLPMPVEHSLFRQNELQLQSLWKESRVMPSHLSRLTRKRDFSVPFHPSSRAYHSVLPRSSALC